MIYTIYIYYDCTEFNVIWSTKEKVVSIVCVLLLKDSAFTLHTYHADTIVEMRPIQSDTVKTI